MIKEAINRILELTEPQTVEVSGVTFSSKQLERVQPDVFPPPETLQVHTLTGIRDYCKSKMDDAEKYSLHVISPTEVKVLGEFESLFGRRKKYVRAQIDDCAFRFNSFYPQEMFIIQVLTQFVDDDSRNNVIAMCSSVSDETAQDFTDDGRSQKVTAKVGVVMKKEITVPNPVTLAPFRTFPEIAQVPSLFVLRVKRGSGQPEFALFEADGGQWRIKAIQSIKEYLAEIMPGITIIA